MRRIRAMAGAILLAFGVAGDVDAQLRVRQYAAGLTTPVAFVQDPTDRDVQFVVQQDGRIRVVRGATLLATGVLDRGARLVSGGEQGLLGLAFAPDPAPSRRRFVDFTDRAGNTVVARFRRPNDPLVADRASRFDLRWGGASGPAYIFQPF